MQHKLSKCKLIFINFVVCFSIFFIGFEVFNLEYSLYNYILLILTYGFIFQMFVSVCKFFNKTN
ncbi:hypothetical protein SAMN05421842_10937 [Clostridium uliginosum]|uniref:Uncharacterized protein n=1 Tax=Clostridium uliginosum TaxID=119641 RepID=A0A1I1LU69_9CLOT|nr:hypothetical protein SAMN05421842_10937 [Clostridium uliginosum]